MQRYGHTWVISLIVLVMGVLAACDIGGPRSSSGGVGGGHGGGGEGGGPPPVGPIVAEVTHYDYTIDLTTLVASSALTLDVKTGGDCYRVPMALPIATNVTWNGQPATNIVTDGYTLSLCGPSVSAGQSLVVGADVVVPEATIGTFDMGYSVNPDIEGGDWAYQLAWFGDGSGCDLFGPCDDATGKLATYHTEVTHPAGMTVLCAGVRTTPMPDRTVCDIAGTKAPTYSARMLTADAGWLRTDLTTAAGVTVALYDVPSGTAGASIPVAAVNTFLPWVTNLLGAFPYGDEVRIAFAPTKWWGMEHPANLVLKYDLASPAYPYTTAALHTFMHEMAHQWAGNRVTLASDMDFAWKEAIAEYLAYVFEDEHRSPPEAGDTRAFWVFHALGAKHWPKPTDSPSPNIRQFYTSVYGAGPMVFFQQLEPFIKRPVILSAIADFLKVPGTRSVEQLIAALESASGFDLDPYMTAWVYGEGAPEWPTFAVTVSQANGQVTVMVEQQNPSGRLYPCVVEIQVSGATSSTTLGVLFPLDGTSTVVSASVPFIEQVTDVAYDPNNKVIGRAANLPAKVAPPVLYDIEGI